MSDSPSQPVPDVVVQPAPEPCGDPIVVTKNQRALIFAVIIVLAGLFAAAPGFYGTWLWDDDQEITANGALRMPGFSGLEQIWKGNVGADWLPLKTTIVWAEYKIWGEDEYSNVYFHLANTTFHIINALLLWCVFRRLKIKWAWVGGLLFAIHPIMVESVAWVSEQKNTISLMFMLLSAICYLNFDERAKWYDAVLAVLFFVASLLCKSAGVVFPFVIILYSWWRHNKFTLRDMPAFASLVFFCGAVYFISKNLMPDAWLQVLDRAKDAAADAKVDINRTGLSIKAFMLLLGAGACGAAWWRLKTNDWRYVARTVGVSMAFFAVTVVIALVTVYFQHKNAIGAEIIPVGGPRSRTVIAGAAIFFYLWKCIWPFDLIPIYPRWVVPEDPPLWMYLPWLALILLFLLFCRYRTTWGRHVIFGLGFFLGNLVPVLGFITMSYMRITWVADHFVYISVIGVIGLAIAGAAAIHEKLSVNARKWFTGFGVAALACLAIDSSWYSNKFLNETNMWRYTLSKNADAWQAHSRYGKVLLDSGQFDSAFYHISESNRLRPDLAETNNNMGVLLQQKGRTAEALPYFKEAVRLMPMGAFIVNYANALATNGHHADAIPQYEALLKANPDNPVFHCNYGFCLFQVGRRDEAIREFKRALELKPDMQDAQRNLDMAMGKGAPQQQPQQIQQPQMQPLMQSYTRTGVDVWQVPEVFKPATSSTLKQ